VLAVTGLTRSFGSRRAIDDVSFTVPSGQVTGFIGGNGAGKTTTMRIILGVLVPDRGEVVFQGRPVAREQSRDFGYMPEERGLYPKMKLAEQIAYLATLHGLSRAAAAARARQLLTGLGLGARLDDTVEKLSLGNQQRAQVAAALAGDPSVLVLDEPFSGLDPMAIDTVAAILRDYVSRGAPLLFSSHQLDLVERICDRVVIIAAGKIRATGSRDELLRLHASNRWEIDGVAPDWLAAQPQADQVETVEEPGQAGQGGRRLRFSVAAADPAAAEQSAQAVLRAALDVGAVRLFAPWRPSLVEVFREVIVDETPQEVSA
jgi:ABC-2 type transport system ATP-binding protein